MPTATADTIVGCSCPGCGNLVQHVAGAYTPSESDEYWRLDFLGTDYGDCATCQLRPEDR